MLSLLLARQGVPVTLLEAHRDFDRDFRGDTIHPSTLEVLEQIGLAAGVHELPHVKAPSFRFVSATYADTAAVFSRLPTPFPYMMVMPQARFLEFLAAEAAKYPHFRLVTGAHVDQLLEEDGTVRGVAYRSGESRGEVRAPLTVGADGRFSRVRKLTGMEPVPLAEPMELLWFRLPRRAEDRYDSAAIAVGSRQLIVVLARTQEWQFGYIGTRGRFRALKAQGIEAFRQSVVDVLPWLGDRVSAIRDFSEISLLSVECSRLVRWHRPGLLLLGDAAHVMSPVGGVGINCAIADAVEAVNVLAEPLRNGRVEEPLLAEVQRRREGVTRTIQRFQTRVQGGVMRALEAGHGFRLPLLLRIALRIPLLRDIPPRITAFGVRRVRLEHPAEVAALRSGI
jgi:2-polyprenyl-6-methoxyphenol hydroxylase-like FAD-dependent oxidoreductase